MTTVKEHSQVYGTSLTATKTKVSVEAKLDSGTIVWTVDSKPPHNAKLDLPNKSGAYEIVFDLDDDTRGRDLRFDCSYPFWVSENVPCPPPRGLHTDQIEVLACSQHSLTIIDRNDGPARNLRYQLNFRDGRGAREQVDPEIINGGSV